MKQIIVIGIGPGSKDDMTVAVRDTIAQADIVVGYKFYFPLINPVKSQVHPRRLHSKSVYPPIAPSHCKVHRHGHEA